MIFTNFIAMLNMKSLRFQTKHDKDYVYDDEAGLSIVKKEDNIFNFSVHFEHYIRILRVQNMIL